MTIHSFLLCELLVFVKNFSSDFFFPHWNFFFAEIFFHPRSIKQNIYTRQMFFHELDEEKFEIFFNRNPEN